MTRAPTGGDFNQHQEVYDLIWSQMPEMQNRRSSSWWFFLLFPRDGEGYGRRQIMFSLATRVGERIRINDVWMPGLDLNRQIKDGVDLFETLAVGWYCDGNRVYDRILKQRVPTVMSARDRSIRGWTSGADDDGYGIELRRSGRRPLALEETIRGQAGSAHFEAWGDRISLHSSPHESLNIDTPIGGVHFIAWRRMNFAGEFDLPTGREELNGLCYFQRVCLNVPTFPWKWIWSLFPDGSMFSAYVPYVGLNLLRKGYRFFSSNRWEQLTLPIMPAAFWDWPDASEQVSFTRAAITPILGRGAHPHFAVKAHNKQGDHIAFQAVPYGHTRFFIDRPVLGGRLETHWSYNEYMFRMEGLRGQVSGQEVSKQAMGQAFGNLEYTWGLGI